MKVIYISGPFSLIPDGYDEVHGIEHNINEASRWALAVARKGWAPICPHKNTAGFQHVSDIPYSFWMDVCLTLVEKSDAILMIPGWEKSPGAQIELKKAEKLGLDIFYWYDDVPKLNAGDMNGN